MSRCKVEILEETPEPWVPIDLHIDHDKEKILMQQIKKCIYKIESSQFYHDFKDQLQTQEISEHLHMVLGSESKMNMVVYGIGKFELYENPKLQLGLAILMQRAFRWIGDIEVFDPALSITECRILEALGCSILQFNEEGKRKAPKPTMFFMPHCSAMLYNNLVQANWKSNSLSNIVIFGNSFNNYISSQLCPREMITHLLIATKFTREFRVKTNFKDYYEDSNNYGCGHRRGAFNNSSWHFFTPVIKETIKIA